MMETTTRQDALREKWGIERYVDALAELSQWYQDTYQGNGATVEQLKKLSPDALEIFGARTLDRTKPV